MLQEQVVIQGKAAVLVVQLSQEVMESDRGQRLLQCNRVPEERDNCYTSMQPNSSIEKQDKVRAEIMDHHVWLICENVAKLLTGQSICKV